MLDDFLGANDITSVREIPLDTGNTLYAKRTDPYGFIHFSLAKGNLPDWMKGNYTSWTEAQKAVQQYLLARNLEKNEIPLPSAKADPKKDTKT